MGLPQRDDAHHLSHHSDVRPKVRVEVRFGQGKHSGVADRRRARRTRLARQKRHLSEHVACTEECEDPFSWTFGDKDLNPAIGDDQERITNVALLEEELAFTIASLGEQITDPLELRLGQVFENVDLAEDIYDVPGRH